MDWMRGLVGAAPIQQEPHLTDTDPEQELLIDSNVNREVSFADILKDTGQQKRVQTQVVKDHQLPVSHRAVDKLDITADSSSNSNSNSNSSTSSKRPLSEGGDAFITLPPLRHASQQHEQVVKQSTTAKGKTAASAAGSSSSNSVKAVMYGLTNLSSVVAIVFANKLVLYTHGFHFAVTLTWLHCIFTTLGMMGMAFVGIFELKRVPLAKSVPVAAVYVGYIVLNNLSIQLNTVGFYQISKIAITPVVVAIEWVCYGKPASVRVLASVAVLMTGITLATLTDSQVASRPLGMLVAGINVIVTGLYQVWAGSKQKELGLNGLQLLHQVSPSSVVLLAVLIPLLEPVGFSSPGPDTILGYTLTPAAAFWIVMSSILGLVVTLSTFLFIGATSSLTFNVVGHMKTVLIVTGGVVFFGDSMSLKKFGGLVTALSGIVWYSSIKLQEAGKAGKG